MPKSRPFGYPETNASGNSTSFAPSVAALAVQSATISSVRSQLNTTGAACTTATRVMATPPSICLIFKPRTGVLYVGNRHPRSVILESLGWLSAVPRRSPMRRIVITFFFGLWTLVAWSPDAHAQRRGLLPTDYYKEISVSQTAISPAGDLVAFTVMTIVRFGCNSYGGARQTVSRSVSPTRPRSHPIHDGHQTVAPCQCSHGAVKIPTRPGLRA